MLGLDNPLHIAFLVVILLLVFGAKRLPEIGRSLGSGMREFKQSVTGESPPQRAEPPTQPAQPALTTAEPPAPAPVPAAQPVQAAPPVQQAPAVEHQPQV